mmetsp:Transcript_1771/g.3842  ORF Transcript_1771/g.3842 Transcript_1771/m.3842 type:complete len:476 (-) Transcript_1771:58-1485(-)
MDAPLPRRGRKSERCLEDGETPIGAQTARLSDFRYGSIEEPGLFRRSASWSYGEQVYPSRQAKWIIEEDKDTLSDIGLVINLLADMSPVGILPLSCAMDGTGYLLAVAFLMIFATAAGFAMYTIARTVSESGHTSSDQIWASMIGPRTAWIPPVVNIVGCGGACLTYFCMAGDLLSSLSLVWAPRSVWVLALAAFPLLPLCMMKDLSLLAPSSLVAVMAVVYTTVVIVVRYMDGSYGPHGAFASPEALKPSKEVLTIGGSTLHLASAFAVGFLSHYNGCKYFREWKGRRPADFVPRIAVAFAFCVVVFSLSMCFGYATFGHRAEAVILMNYAPNDTLVNIARVGMGFALIMSIPLNFSGLREASLALMTWAAPSQTGTWDLMLFQNVLSGILLTGLAIATLFTNDVGLVVGFFGAMADCTVIYILPSLLFDVTMTRLMMPTWTCERTWARVIGMFGCTALVLGVYATLKPLRLNP